MLSLVLTLAIIGFIVYLITTYIPMPPPFTTIIYVVVAVGLILYAMRIFGIADVPVPSLR